MSETATESPLALDGLVFESQATNVPDDQLLANVKQAIRRGHPQVQRQPYKPERVCLVGSGPSLAETFDELRQLVFEGAHLVTVNGAYHWCLERNLKPNAQIVLDARPSNARFLVPDVPKCRYYLASQCDPASFDAVDGREFVGVYHAIGGDGPVKDELDAYYLQHWHGVMGGTTVITRAIGVLRMLGYLRFDLFGVDSCWMGDQHHAFDQPENEADKRFTFTVAPTDAPEKARVFQCAPWHAKQVEDFLLIIQTSGDHFLLNVHGDGLLAYMLNTAAELQIAIERQA